VPGFPIRQEPHAAVRVSVEVDLRVLVAALVLQEYETFGIRRLRHARVAHRLGIERELLASAHWRRHAMHLIGVSETGRDEHAAVRLPIEKRRAPRLQISMYALDERRVTRRDAIEDEIAALLTRWTGRVGQRRGGSGQENEQGGCFTHDLLWCPKPA